MKTAMLKNMSASTGAIFAAATSSCENFFNMIMGAVVAASFLFVLVSILFNLHLVGVLLNIILIISVLIITQNRERKNKLIEQK